MVTFNALSNGWLQMRVDGACRGRVMEFYALVFIGLSQAVGSFALGALAGLVSASHAIALSAGVLLVASLPAFRRGGFWRTV